MCALLSVWCIFNQLRPLFRYGTHSLILVLTSHYKEQILLLEFY
jgi:hypothetical protein